MIATAPQAAYQNEYSPPKLVSRGPSSVEPKGGGSVTVQVLVNADGTFKVMRVIRSTNPADNAAAMDIARHSTYAPAHRGGKNVRDFFDFTVAFGGNAVSGAAAQIDTMLHNSQWQDAKNAATTALAQSSDDRLVQAQLGVADAFLHDIPGAVAAFDKAGTVPDQYSSIAMQAYSLNAQSLASTDPKAALAQAQKAVSLGGDYGAYYALGVAQKANGDTGAALASLQKAESLAATAQPAADAQTRMNIQEEIMFVDIAKGDNAAAQQEAAKLDSTDPTMSKKVVAYFYDQQGAALQAKTDYNGAVALYEKAAAADPQWAGAPEYTKSAIIYASMSMPDYLKAKADADKAIAADGNYALAYYIAGVALWQNAHMSGNDDQAQDSNIYLRKAADLAKAQGNAKLAQDAAYFEQNHTLNSNLAFWSTQISVRPSGGTGPQRGF